MTQQICWQLILFKFQTSQLLPGTRPRKQNRVISSKVQNLRLSLHHDSFSGGINKNKRILNWLWGTAGNHLVFNHIYFIRSQKTIVSFVVVQWKHHPGYSTGSGTRRRTWCGSQRPSTPSPPPTLSGWTSGPSGTREQCLRHKRCNFLLNIQGTRKVVRTKWGNRWSTLFHLSPAFSFLPWNLSLRR